MSFYFSVISLAYANLKKVLKTPFKAILIS